MMHTLRKVAVAVMFAVLIVAFAISMGGNNYFDRYTRPSVAKVGSIEITPEQFQRVYRRAADNLSARAGRRITPEQAKAFQLPDRVLKELIQETALDYEAGKLGLGLSPAGLGQSIMSSPMFQDAAGKFSRDKYQQFLQRIGYNELGFEQEYRNDAVRRQIQGMFATSGVVPAVMMDAYNRYTNEQRTVAYFTAGPSAAGDIAAPSEEALRAYYDERKVQFMAPELRKLALLVVTPQTVASKIDIPEAELKAEYDAKTAEYAQPERRQIEYIAFHSKQAAEAASAVLKAQNSFADVAKRAGFEHTDIALGSVSKKELGQKIATNDAVLNAAFGLKTGEISAPVNGPLSWIILRVLEITPGKEKSFDEVKDQIRDNLVKARSTTEMARLIKALEEDRAAGVQLTESAKKLNLAIDEVTISRTGNGADGKPVQLSGGVPAPVLATAAFKSDIGVENEAMRLPGGGYAWFDLTEILKTRQRPFEEVKADVEADWRKAQIRTKLSEKARELVARLNRGEAIEEVAKSIGAEVKTTQPLKRGAADPDLPPASVAQAFSLAEGAASSVAGSDGQSRAVFKVMKAIAPGPLDEAGVKAQEQRLSAQISEDNFASYVAGLEKTAGVSVDRKSFAAVAGGAYEGDD